MIKLRTILSVLALTLLAFVVSEGRARSEEAGRFNWQLLDQVEAERDSCAAGVGQEASDPLTQELLRGGFGYGRCLERIIKKVATEFYPKDAFGEGGINVYIEEIRKPYQKTYWTIYNQAGPCGNTGCGSLYVALHTKKWNDLMDNLLTDMIDHLKELH